MRLRIPKHCNTKTMMGVNSKKMKSVPSKYKVSSYSNGYKKEYVKNVIKQFSMVSVDDANTKHIVEQEEVTYKDNTTRKFEIEMTQRRTPLNDVLSEERKIKVIKR